jgi:hypothetical protein
MVMLVVFPLFCIWYREDMGGYTGPTGLVRQPINQTSPGCLVAFGGWVLLLLILPIAATWMSYVVKNG